MALEPLPLLSLNCLLFGFVSLISDQVYRYFKFRGSLNGGAFCFYDNFFMGWYYFLAMIYFLCVGAWLMKAKPTNPKSRIWRVIKMISFFTFFIESEAVLQFVYMSRDIEYQVEEISDQQAIYAFVMLGVIRWSISLFSLNHTSMALEQIIHEATGYSVTGSGFTVNRYRVNVHYGWVSQTLADYIVLHYLIYEVLYSPASPFYVLKSDDFYNYPSAGPVSARTLFTGALVLGGYFYTARVRKEITFFNFVM